MQDIKTSLMRARRSNFSARNNNFNFLFDFDRCRYNTNELSNVPRFFSLFVVNEHGSRRFGFTSSVIRPNKANRFESEQKSVVKPTHIHTYIYVRAHARVCKNSLHIGG